MGKPVIVTATGALPELVMPAVTGWLLPADDPGEIAWALNLAFKMGDDVRATAWPAAPASSRSRPSPPRRSSSSSSSSTATSCARPESRPSSWRRAPRRAEPYPASSTFTHRRSRPESSMASTTRCTS